MAIFRGNVDLDIQTFRQGKAMTDKHIETALVQAGRAKRYTQGSVNSVIQRASSLVFDSVAAKNRPPPGARRANCFTGDAAR